MNDQHAQEKILIADDDPGIQELLHVICESIGLTTKAVFDGEHVMEVVAEWEPDLILMDAMMPGKDGFTVTAELKQRPEFKRIPIIMLTGLKSQDDRLKGIKAGAADFLSKPIHSKELALRVQNQLKIKEYAEFLLHHNEILEEQVKQRTALVQESYLDAIYRLGVVSEYKDEDTGAHISRISYYAREIAAAMGLDSDFRETLFHAASMHDIGKVGIPDRIMLKEGPLDSDEWVIMRSHTTLGAKILARSNSPYLAMGEKIALSHHERWDGTGYPEGISGEAIPLEARITGIVDQYDALRSRRAYKPPFSHEEAVRIIIDGDGRTRPEHFDPRVLDTFKRIQSRFDEIFQELTDKKQQGDGGRLVGEFRI